jgi:hypothetical protein
MRTNVLCLCVCVLACAGGALADKVMLGVPDWHQPGDILYNIAGYPNWCAPTASADLMGYWEDQRGCPGLTDSALPANAPLWQQGLCHDATVEIGWDMDTGGWRTNGGPFPPNAGNTILNTIGPGAVLYAQSAWNDASTGLGKVGYANAGNTLDNQFVLAMWTKYMSEIDNNKPVLVSFKGWANLGAAPGNKVIDGQNCQTWPVQILAEGHTTCGVGYSDPTPNQLNGDEWMVVQDTWSATSQFVAIVPTAAFWVQNDYIDIPEPVTVFLLGVGGLAMICRGRARAASRE